ncbi:SPOR domain-containing protein [Roseateles sp.]|uniref:SPOR domain-containing protein n=1 Tax=Roseateles sp. TaxID=1971397 RepID=UPI00286C8BA2|nr:SPOR domain-containing protein [Roseateles sp.]
MGLLSFFKRGEAGPAPKTPSKAGAKPVADAADAVQHLRLRARHRLIGAALLVGVGVIGFPLLFETQPRPIPVDLPIDIPSKEAAPPLRVPAQLQAPALPPLAMVEPEAEPQPQPASPPVSKQVDALPQEPLPTLVAKPEPKASVKTPEKSADRPLEKKPVEPQLDRTGSEQEAARAQSLLDGKPVEAGGRSIVQVGAFADAKAAHEVRMKVEKLGLKTYTQVLETPTGKRVRVRVGPFASKDEADKAAARLRAVGLSPAVLTL